MASSATGIRSSSPSTAHFWPPGRTTLRNADGREVEVHLTNYQDRYYGGSGMIRLYQLDLDRNTIEVSTFSPWMLARCRAGGRSLSALERGESELTDAANRFVRPFDFGARFAGLRPPAPPPAPVPAERVVIPGTLAYWRLGDLPAGPLPETGVAVSDRSGHGNHLQRVILAGGRADDLGATSDFHPLAPSRGSLFFNGSKVDPALGGAYLRTSAAAPLNRLTLADGYTVEAFLRLPADCCGSRHAWMGVLSRMGSGAGAGKSSDDPSEPVATLTVSPGRQLQWAVYPLPVDAMRTSWSHELPPDRWLHVAVVNDGRRQLMYVDGARVLRNPRADSVGVSTTGEFWLVGATHYDGVVEQSFYGHLGDVRIVGRPLAPSEFMNTRP